MPRKASRASRKISAAKATVEQQRAIRALKDAASPHHEIVDAARVSLAQRIANDIDWWYERAKYLAENASKDDRPQVEMVTTMLNKILAEKKEREEREPGNKGKGAQGFIFNIGGDVNRGTVEARESAKTVEVDIT